MEFKISLTDNENTRVGSYNRKLCRVGRTNAHIILNDPYCSRVHAEFYVNFDMTLWIRDLNSRNGLYLNGNRVQKARVRNGDVIRVGRTQLTIVKDILTLPQAENRGKLSASPA